MALNKLTSISTFLLFNIILAMACNAQAGRVGPTKPKEGDMKKPECFQEGSVLIPGVGRYMPGEPHGSISAEIPRYGDLGAGTGRQYIPGGDDTLVPNPGYETPIPSNP